MTQRPCYNRASRVIECGLRLAHLEPSSHIEELHPHAVQSVGLYPAPCKEQSARSRSECQCCFLLSAYKRSYTKADFQMAPKLDSRVVERNEMSEARKERPYDMLQESDT